MNQGKLEVLVQEMATLNISILGISELKWMGMGEFNSGNHYIFYCGQESLRRNGVAIIVNKRVWNVVLGCNLKKRQNDLCSFPRQTIQHHNNPSLCPKHWWWRSWCWPVLWRLITPSRTNTKKRCPFYNRGLKCKTRKPRDPWNNRQVWPWRTKWIRANADRGLSKEHADHSKYPFQQPKRQLYVCISPDG